MKKTILSYCNTIVTLAFVILVFYISFFTDIPAKTSNIIKEKYEEYNNEYTEYNSDFSINKLGIKNNTHYYDQLSDGQKNIYSAIANGVKNYKKEFVVRNYTAAGKDDFANEVSTAISAFINDHPEVFYLQANYSTYVLEKFDGYIGYIKLNYTEENVDDIVAKIDAISLKVDEILSQIEGTTDYEKELFLHDYVAKNSKYFHGEDIPRKYHTIEGTFLEGEGVCDSFSKVFQILLDKCDINSIIVLGSMGSTPHAWNMVNLDGEWYHTDITSSRSILDETGVISHAYFNVTTDREKKFCEFDAPYLVPEATGLKYNYYNYNGFIASSDNLDEKLGDVYEKLDSRGYLEFYFEDNVSDNINDILVTVKHLDLDYMNGNSMSYYNIENAIIIPKN